MSFVITAYGHDNVIDRIAVSSFEGSGSRHWGNENNAQTYCIMLNALEFSGTSWASARIVPENTPFLLAGLLPFKFQEILLAMDGRSIQKVLAEIVSRKINNRELARALKGCSEAVMEKVLKNMSQRASQTLKEDMEYTRQIPGHYVIQSQEKIIKIIKDLEDTGEIVLYPV